jgi:hypothetical protein
MLEARLLTADPACPHAVNRQLTIAPARTHTMAVFRTALLPSRHAPGRSDVASLVSCAIAERRSPPRPGESPGGPKPPSAGDVPTGRADDRFG